MKIFITGASTGIGKFLALEYAKRGAVLGLAARRKELLDILADECHSLGGRTYIYQLDVADTSSCKLAAENFIQSSGGIDIVIANAGIGNHDNIMKGDASIINGILETNILGVTNTLIPFLPKMKEQKRGILVPISSVASFFPIPFHGGYSASKRAVRMIADAWRLTLHRYHIQITTICPGFIETPMTEEQSNKPFLLDVETASKKIIKAIEKKKKTYIFPWQMRILVLLLRRFPEPIFRWASKTLLG